MNINNQKKLLQKELEKFSFILGEILPKYLDLLKKSDKSDDEKKELIKTEETLLEINTKIAEIKIKLDNALFGEKINLYYQTKAKAKTGDLNSKIYLEELKKNLEKSIKTDSFYKKN